MKHMRGFLIILSISFIGEVLNAYIPLPVPASIYGLVLMLLCLIFGIVKLESVKTPGKFLIEIMPLMFIPSAAALMDNWSALRPLLIPVAVISVVSTLVVMISTGWTAQSVVRRTERRRVK